MQKTSLLWGIIGALLVTNLVGVGVLLTDKDKMQTTQALKPNSDVVATIDKETITRKEWLNELEDKYGKEVLKELINDKVVAKLAEDNNLTVTKEEMDREMHLIQSAASESANMLSLTEEQLEKKVKNTILFEKYLTKDVEIPEEQLKDFYNKNKSLYNTPDLYRVSRIVVKDKEQIDSIYKDLESGSVFSTLARETSIDSTTVSNGGDLGYLDLASVSTTPEYQKVIPSLKVKSFSEPIKTALGYEVLFLEGTLEGKNYAFDEVKGEILRQLALQQINAELTVEDFWDEANVKTEVPVTK